MSKSLLKAVERQMDYGPKQKTFDGVNAFSVIKDGVVIDEGYSKACYASLDRHSPGVDYIVVYFMKDRGKWRLTKEAHKPFLEYLFNESPYKDVFLIKDVEYCLKYGVLCNTEVPSNLLVGGLTVLRSLWEYTHIPIQWKALVDLGVQADMALLAAHILLKDGERYRLRGQGMGHRAFDPDNITKVTAKNFFTRTPPNAKENYKDSGTYSSINTMWGSGGDILFSGYKQKTTGVVMGWGGGRVEPYDNSLEPIAEWLIEEYSRIMKPPKEKPMKKTVKKSTEHPLIALITVRNGFTLGEVREIRKNLREIIAGGAALGWRKEGFGRHLVDKHIQWVNTPQGEAYWNKVHVKLGGDDRGF